MLRDMPIEQFQEWMAFDEIEPIGGRRGDWQAASVVSTLYNLQRNRERYPEPFSPEMFLLEHGKAPSPLPTAKPAGMPWQQMKFLAQAYVAGVNQENARGRRP